MEHREHCDLLAGEVPAFAAVVGDVPPAAPVPSCPGWDVVELTRHVGRVHRWAEGLVRSGGAARPPHREADPEEPEVPGPDWIVAGGEVLLATLRAADPDAPMWAWGADQHVRFWSRRMLHETVVHRVDAELAAGREPSVPPAVAADGIDELLANLVPRLSGGEAGSALRGRGEVLAVRPADAPAAWAITLGAEGFSVGSDPGRADAELAGPAAGLLLALYRRRTPAEAGVSVGGDGALVARWLANTAM